MSVEEKERKKERKKVCVCVCVCIEMVSFIENREKKLIVNVLMNIEVVEEK